MEHILKIAQMAEETEQLTSEKWTKLVEDEQLQQTDTVNNYSTSTESNDHLEDEVEEDYTDSETEERVEVEPVVGLSQQELDHIQQINALAETELEQSAIKTPLISSKIETKPQTDKFAEKTTKLTSFGFKSLLKVKDAVTKAAEQIQDVYSAEAKQPEPEAKLSETTSSTSDLFEPLSEEELLHIAKIAELANSEFPPTDERFWASDVHQPSTFISYRSSFEDSAVDLDENKDISPDFHLASTGTADLSDYEMADETFDEASKVEAFRWYEQQLNELNRSLDEVDEFGPFPVTGAKDEHNPNFVHASAPENETAAIQVPKDYKATTLDEINARAHEFKQAPGGEEPVGINNVNVPAKIDVLAATEAARALQAAVGTIFPEKKWLTSVPPFGSIAKTEEYGLEEREKSSFVKPLPPAVNAVSSQVAEPAHQFLPECRTADNQSQINTATSDTTAQVLITDIPNPPSKMFGSKSKSGGIGGFGGFSKFASDAFKNAKQAGEQLGAKAAQAAQAASTGDLTQIGKTLQSTVDAKPPPRSQSTMLPSTLAGPSTAPAIPPGLEDLSQEERDRIMAVMACAEIDAAQPGPIMPTISASRTDDKLFRPSPQQSFIETKVMEPVPSPLSAQTGPTIEELGLTHLSPAEQEQILSVMRQAEMQGASMAPMTAQHQPASTHDFPMTATIVHEQLNDKDGAKTRKVSIEKRQFAEQRQQDASPIDSQKSTFQQPEIPFSTSNQHEQQIKISDSGYTTAGSTSYDMDLDKHVTRQPQAQHPPEIEEVSQPMLPESFEIDDDPEDSYYAQEDKVEELPAQNQEYFDDWSKPDVLQQYGGVVVSELKKEPSIEAIRVTEAKEDSSQVDAVELDDDIWMQPRHEYKAPEHWEPKSGRMWTTVFSDDGESVSEESTRMPNVTDEYNDPISDDEARRFTVDEDWSIEPEKFPTATMRRVEPIGETSTIASAMPAGVPEGFDMNDFTPQEQEHLVSVFGKSKELNYEVQMDDPLSPIVNVTAANAPVQPLQQQPHQPYSAPRIQQVEEPEYETSKMPEQQQQQQQQMPGTLARRAQPSAQHQKHVRAPPEIKVTIHEEKEKTSDEESEEETPPSSDEDDYPDQIIEAPSAAPMSFTEMEHERETQSAFAQEVLQQIQSFGESANDEFEWKQDSGKNLEKQPKMAPAEPEREIPRTIVYEPEPVQPTTTSATSTMRPSSNQRINPFLESPEEEEEPEAVYVEQQQLDNDDIDYSQAAQYYRAHGVSDKIEHQQHQRKINTIPEGEEEDNIVNTEGRYHAKELERKPLHGNSIPPLITPEDKKPKKRLAKTYTSSSSATASPAAPPASSTSVPSTAFTPQIYDNYGTSQAYYISAGSSAPTYTWATTQPVTSHGGQGQTVEQHLLLQQQQQQLLQYQQHQQQQQQQLQQQQSKYYGSDPQIKVTIPESSSESPGPLTPIRHAPPPPEAEQQQQLLASTAAAQSVTTPTAVFASPSTATPHIPNGFKSDIHVAEDLIPIQNHHPLHPHVHQKEQTPQHAYFQHEFVPANSDSDAAFLAQIGSLTRDKQTLGSQLITANHTSTDMEDDQATPRLKRSPAMILPNDKQDEQQQEFFSFPPPTYSRILASTLQQQQQQQQSQQQLAQMHPQQANSVPDGISTGVLMKRPFIRDEDVLLLISGANSTTATSSASIEMGRRKLPSLPQPYMGTGVNAPVYYTSSAPEPKDAACGTAGGILFDPSTASTTTRLTSASRIQPSTSGAISSRPSSALGMHSADPAILPGATFKIATKPRQTIIMPNGDLSNNNKQRKLPKMTDTMSRVMLKKELREVLSKRRDKLDTCEIEANHRQYVINRMLTSGLMPEHRMSELDEIPAVVKCTLPPEIVKNARIVPIKRPQISVRSDVSSFHQQPKTKSEGTSTINWLEEEGIRQFNMTSNVPHSSGTLKKSIAIQCEAPPKSVGTCTMPSAAYAGHYSSSTSLKRQMMAESEDYARSGRKTVETQTDNVSDSLKRKKFPKPTGLSSASSLAHRDTATTASGPDLLESTQRYFEEYDRRLREASTVRVDKQRFNFTDNDIESKRQQVLDELAKRREKISSMVDLRYLQQQPHSRMPTQPLPSSDYASTVPHYGSLPRIDYPARNRMPSSSQLRDFTSKPNTSYYGSLPRNYERYLDSMDQPYVGQSVMRPSPGNLSRSLFDLNQTDPFYPSYTQPANLQPMYARSENFVDQLTMDDLFLNRNMNQNMPQTSAEADNMLSQYANYLNNQFLMAQQRDNYGDPLTDSYDISPPMPPPMEQFQPVYQQQQQHQAYQPQTSAYMDQQLLSNQFDQLTRPSQVYSRTERNYGSRPPQAMADYGNYMHNRVQSLRQLDNLQDLVNHNVGVVPHPVPPNNYNPPLYNYQPSPWDNGYNSSRYNYEQQQQQQQQQQLLQQQQVQQLQQQQRMLQRQQQQLQQQRPPPTTMNTSAYDAKYPREDGLNKMYQSYGRRQRQPYGGGGAGQYPDYLQVQQANPEQQYSTSSLGRNMTGRNNNTITTATRGRSMTNIGREINELLREHPESRQRTRHVGKIKRILLTRRYKDSNFVNDIGIRVTGGKRMPNGDLGAFVTAVNRGKGFETLCEIHEGDQVLEWNGIFLSGKTYEEVERIINGSRGEIEITVKSNDDSSSMSEIQQAENVYDSVNGTYRAASRKYPPPVPAHRSFSPSYGYQGRASNQGPSGFSKPNSSSYYQTTNRDSIGTLQLSFAYDQINGLLLVNIIGARNLRYREYDRGVILPNPFVKVYLLPGRKAINKRRTRYICNMTDPEWLKQVDYPLNYHELTNYYLEFTVWDYGKEDNVCLGQVIVSLSDVSLLNNVPRSFPLQRPDQSAIIHGLSNGPAPTTRLRTQSYYNPTALDLGYPAIC